MSEFTKDSEYVYLNVPYAEAYIPEELFADPDKKATIASEYGEGIRCIGLFYIRIFESRDQPRSAAKLKTFKYPNMIEMYPSETSSETLDIDGTPDKYRVLKFVKGDIIMNSFVKKSSSNCELFLKLLTSGKIPRSISYNDLLDIWSKNFQINDVNPGVPSVTMQIILSEMCRYKTDPAKQFRKIAGKGGVDMHSYMSANMNEVSSYSSIMSALTFERFSDKLATSLTMTKTGAKQIKSPIEKIISY